MAFNSKNNSVKANAKKITLRKNLVSTGDYLKRNQRFGKYSWVYFSEDPIFNDFMLNKFIGMFVKKGKKEKVLKIFYSLFGVGLRKRIPIGLFFNIIERLKPAAICVPVRTGSIINQVPMPIFETKAYRKALMFLTKAIRDRRDVTLQEKIFNEFEAVFKETGYCNVYWKTNADFIEVNGHLRHFRRFGIY